MASLNFACVVVVMCMVAVSVSTAEASITCGQVESDITPCRNYLEKGGSVPPACCDGVRSINNAASTTADRQAVCNCLKTLVQANPSVDFNLTESLPSTCGVNVSYKITPSTDCSTIR